MTRHEDKEIQVMAVHDEEEGSLTKGDDDSSSFGKEWPLKKEKQVWTGDRFFLVAIGILILCLAGVEVARLVTRDAGCSKEVYYGIAGLVLVVSLGTTLVLYIKHSENKEEESAEVFTSNNNNRRLSIDTLQTGGSAGESLPPSPPPPPLRKELSTATIQHDNRSTAVAEYFPSVSVLFADIVGFTAWSSIRDPFQVFTLLESLYEAFDKIAEEKSVFKVETIGDCYVGATGLPKQQDDHAVIMSTFARRILDKAISVFQDLEMTLGPGTAELGIRMGIHSGSVMAGVLRGAKSRYQLFGDTMNVTSRIESTGTKNKIHLSQSTAELLQAAGKGEWAELRQDKVVAKGKGELQTFWLTTSAKNLSPDVKLALPAIAKFLKKAKVEPAFCENQLMGDGKGRLERLVDYNTKVMEQLLKRVVAVQGDDCIGDDVIELISERYTADTIVQEAKKDIPFLSDWQYVHDAKRVDLGCHVSTQLESFVRKVASLYRDLPFHCFEHASHTILSVTKLLASLEATLGSFEAQHHLDFESRINENVCEMLTHPMAQFALVFAAMVHDIEYEAPNYQLVREGSKIAKTFKNKSCAEQNSIHSAWTLLMQPAYKDLRECLFGSQEDVELFRSLLVKSVMSTDVFDKDQASARVNRWNALQSGLAQSSKSRASEESLSLQKAAVVVEHLIQISDVSHTVQHLHVYTKWNKLLFKEMFLGYKAGRASNDPSKSWYEGELKFFDWHVIPLAQRLCECQVFRASAEICLTNAVNNRRKWEQKGNSIVDEGLKLYETKSEVTNVISQRVRRVPSMVAHNR